MEVRRIPWQKSSTLAGAARISVTLRNASGVDLPIHREGGVAGGGVRLHDGGNLDWLDTPAHQAAIHPQAALGNDRRGAVCISATGEVPPRRGILIHIGGEVFDLGCMTHQFCFDQRRDRFRR